MAQREPQRRHLIAFIALFIAVTPSAGASAQETSTLVERDAVSLGLEGHRGLAAARLRARAAAAGETEAEGLFPWLLDARAEYTHQDQPVRDAFTEGVQIRDTFSWSVGVAKVFPFGTELAVAFSNVFTASETPIAFEVQNGIVIEDRRVIGPLAVAALTLDATHHILKGGSYHRNTLPERAAARQRTLAELAVENEASAALLDVLEAYWALRLAQAEVELRDAGITRLEQQREVTAALIEAGLIAEIELGVVEQQLLTAQESELLSRLARDQRILTLRRLTGSDLLEQQTLIAVESYERPIPALDVTRELEQARAQSIALRQIEERIALQELEVERFEDDLLPTLDVSLNLTQQGLDDNLSDSDVFLDAYKQVAFLEAGAVTVGLVFSTPLDFDRAHAQQSAAQHELSALELERAEAEALLTEQLLTLSNTFQSTRERLILLDRAVDLAERNLAAGDERFRAGLITNLDVGRLQEALEAARIQRAAARIELIRQRLAIDHATGQLLNRFDIVLTDDGAETQIELD